MKLVPVVDLLDGQVVHAIAGNRSQYQPFKDSRFHFDSPRGLVQLLIEEFAPDWIYVADLNAIQGIGDNLDCINRLAQLPTCFLLDLGFANWHHYLERKRMINSNLNWLPVFGSESVGSFADLAQQAEPSECIVSVDVKRRQVLSPGSVMTEDALSPQSFGSTEDESLVSNFLLQLGDLGFHKVILLDLDAVGQGTFGLDGDESALPSRLPNPMEIFAGGGVRNQDDLHRLAIGGFAGALIATAIHSGDIRGGNFKDGMNGS